MLNIVVPMAGAGSRFAKIGYDLPKPLIPIDDIPMIQLVIENIRPSRAHRFIFVCQAVHVRDFSLDSKLRSWAPGCEVLPIDGLTEGAACTVLTAREYIDTNDALMIANCDQYVDTDIDAYLDAMTSDGLIMTMTASDTKWSYAKTDADGFIETVVEKEVISDQATVGIYNFAKGSDFIAAADRMIAADFRVNGEFYVAPVYNYAIADGKKFKVYSIGSDTEGMYGLGTPDDYEAFCKIPIKDKALEAFR